MAVGKAFALLYCAVAEQEELLREMGQQAAKPTPEVSLLRQQVDQLHSRHRTELALLEHDKLQLQQRLQAEVFGLQSTHPQVSVATWLLTLTRTLTLT